MRSESNSIVNPVTEGNIKKEVLLFFFPIFFGSLFQQVYNAADAMIVGRFLGKEALSAVGGSAGMIILLVVGFFVGLSSGASVLVSQYYGAKNEERVSASVHTVMMFGLLCGILITFAGIVLTPAMLRLLETPADTMEMSVIYLRVYFAGMTGNLLYNIGSGVLRAAGDSRRPFLFLVVCCVLNIVLDLIFIIPMGMGVFGAALATILSQAVSAVLVIIIMCRTEDSYRLRPAEAGIDPGIIEKMMKIGLPAGLQSVMYGVSNLIIQAGVNGLGTDHVAAWATYYKIDGLFWMAMYAYGIAASTFVGQNYGAGHIERVKKSFITCMVQAAAAAVLISAVIYSISPWLFPLFTTDPGVNKIGVDMMRYLTRFYVLYVSVEIIPGALRGVGDTLIPMFISGAWICLLRSIWIIFVMPLKKDMYTMMFSYPLSWSICTAAFFIYLFRYSSLKEVLRKKDRV